MNLNELLFKKIFTLRNLFLWGNVVLFLLLAAALGKDQVRGWKTYQKEFKNKEIARIEAKLKAAESEAAKDLAHQELKVAKSMKLEIRQIWSQEMDAVDRCITCHLGYDPLSNPSLENTYTEQPYSASGESPALDIHKAHNLEKFGCVVCHGGQGLATEVDDAHGTVLHWEKPLLTGTFLQSSCAKCHDNLSELTFKGINYASEIIRAKSLFKEHGCIGCHQIAGEGGPISVDLREETSAKPLSRIDFSSTGLEHKDWTLYNWIKIHFTKDPATFVPGDPKAEFNTEPIAPSAMPPYLLSEKDADALTAYILSLNRKDVPTPYLTLRPREPEPQFSNVLARGQYVYEKYGCNACHGKDARGGIRNYNYQYNVTPNLRRVVGSYTREELKHKINEGVPIVAKHDPHGPLPPLYMPAWKSKIKGEELESLVSYLMSLKE